MEEQEIHKFIKNNSNKEIKKAYMGVFGADEFNKFDKLGRNVKWKKSRNYFGIFNTQKRNSTGDHWIGVLKTKNSTIKNQIMVFDSFGKTGFKKLFISDDLKEFRKFCVYKNGEKLADNGEVDVFSIKVDILKYLEYRYKLSALSQSFFNFAISINSENGNVNNTIDILYIFDQLQSKKSLLCGGYVLYFFDSLFKQKKILNRDLIEKTLTEIFEEINKGDVDSLTQENEKIIQDFIKDYNIKTVKM